MKQLTRTNIINIANKTLAFIEEKVGTNPKLIRLVLDTAINQDKIEEELFQCYSNEKKIAELDD